MYLEVPRKNGRREEILYRSVIKITKNTRSDNSPWLLAIYNASLRLRYIPWSWRISRVIFIPKAGKPFHTKANYYKPISLCPFLLKTLEAVLDVHIRVSIDPTLLMDYQHAYTRGKSVDWKWYVLLKTGPEHFSSSAGILQRVSGGGDGYLLGLSVDPRQRCLLHSRLDLF